MHRIIHLLVEVVRDVVEVVRDVVEVELDEVVLEVGPLVVVTVVMVVVVELYTERIIEIELLKKNDLVVSLRTTTEEDHTMIALIGDVQITNAIQSHASRVTERHCCDRIRHQRARSEALYSVVSSIHDIPNK